MKTMMKLICPLAAVALVWSAVAGELTLTGKHSVVYDVSSQEGKASATKMAQRYAAIHAIEQMMSSQPSAIRQLYQDRKPGIMDEILALCSQVNNEQSIAKNKNEVTVVFSAVIDEDALKDLLQRKDAVQQTVELDSTEIAVFFTARNAASVRKQNSSMVNDSTSEKNKKASNSGNIDDENVQSESNVVERETKTTDVATIVNADRINYELDAPAREEFGTALISRFAEKGFEEIIDGAMLDASALLDEAYGSGDVVPAKTWRSIVSNLRENEPTVQYMVVGTLDLGIPRVDEQTNMWVVEATVSGKIYKMSRNIPRVVTALSPQTQKAKAADQLQAKKRALSGLTPLAADEILAKLKAKKIIKSNEQSHAQ